MRLQEQVGTEIAAEASCTLPLHLTKCSSPKFSEIETARHIEHCVDSLVLHPHRQHVGPDFRALFENVGSLGEAEEQVSPRLHLDGAQEIDKMPESRQTLPKSKDLIPGEDFHDLWGEDEDFVVMINPDETQGIMINPDETINDTRHLKHHRPYDLDMELFLTGSALQECASTSSSPDLQGAAGLLEPSPLLQIMDESPTSHDMDRAPLALVDSLPLRGAAVAPRGCSEEPWNHLKCDEDLFGDLDDNQHLTFVTIPIHESQNLSSDHLFFDQCTLCEGTVSPVQGIGEPSGHHHHPVNPEAPESLAEAEANEDQDMIDPFSDTEEPETASELVSIPNKCHSVPLAPVLAISNDRARKKLKTSRRLDITIDESEALVADFDSALGPPPNKLMGQAVDHESKAGLGLAFNYAKRCLSDYTSDYTDFSQDRYQPLRQGNSKKRELSQVLDATPDKLPQQFTGLPFTSGPTSRAKLSSSGRFKLGDSDVSEIATVTLKKPMPVSAETFARHVAALYPPQAISA